MTAVRAHSVELASTAGGPARLCDLCAGGPVILLFAGDGSGDCIVALRRLAPSVELLARLGITIAAVFRVPIGAQAALAARAGFRGAALVETPQDELSSWLGIRSIPSAVLVEDNGVLTGRAEECESAVLEALLEQACLQAGAPAVLAAAGA
jgi:hypothetical protein